MKSLAKNTFFNILYEVVSLVFPLVYSMYVARVLFAGGVGKVSFANNIVSYFILFASFGLPTYSVREIAKCHDNQNEKNTLFSELFLLNGIFTTVVLLIYTGCLCFIPFMRENYLLYICCGIPLLLNYFNIEWLYKGNEEFGFILVRSIVIKLSMTVALLLFVHRKEDYIIYALILSMATTGNYLFNVVHARKIVKLTIKNLNLKKHIKPVCVFFAGMFMASAYSRLDVLMLGIFGDSSAVGYYSYAQKTINIIITICTAFSAASLPRLSYYYEHEKEKFYDLIRKGSSLLFFIAIPLTVGCILLAESIVLVLYGNSFSGSIMTVRILGILIFIKGLGDLLCYQLVMSTGYEKIRIPAAAVASIINAVLNFILIPLFMQSGAAVASVISELIVNIGQFIYVSRKLHIQLSLKAFFQSILISAIMGMCIFSTIHFFEMKPIAIFVIGTISGIIVYLVLNVLLRTDMFYFIKNKVYRLLRRT